MHWSRKKTTRKTGQKPSIAISPEPLKFRENLSETPRYICDDAELLCKLENRGTTSVILLLWRQEGGRC